MRAKARVRLANFLLALGVTSMVGAGLALVMLVATEKPYWLIPVAGFIGLVGLAGSQLENHTEKLRKSAKEMFGVDPTKKNLNKEVVRQAILQKQAMSPIFCLDPNDPSCRPDTREAQDAEAVARYFDLLPARSKN